MLRQLSKNTANNLIRAAASTSRTMSSSSSTDSVLINEVHKCGILTLNRPKALNALNLEMVRTIYPVMQRWETANKSLVIIKSGLEKAFCAGGDVRTLVTDPQSAYQFFREEYTLNHLIGTYRIPFVALISGITMGGGVGLSVHGRYRVATEKTMFAMPETAIGLFPDVGGSHFLPRLAGELGTYLGLTGARLKGRDVLAAGIATHFCAHERLADLELALIECGSAADVERTLSKYCPVDVSAQFSLAPFLEQINRCFGAPTVEEIVQRLEADGSEWALGTLKLLKPVSPLSLKVSKRLLERGAGLTLGECLQMELRLATRHAEKSDFAEGVRALLIDRDNAPKWEFESLAAVPEDRVEAFYAPFEQKEKELKL